MTQAVEEGGKDAQAIPAPELVEEIEAVENTADEIIDEKEQALWVLLQEYRAAALGFPAGRQRHKALRRLTQLVRSGSFDTSSSEDQTLDDADLELVASEFHGDDVDVETAEEVPYEYWEPPLEGAGRDAQFAKCHRQSLRELAARRTRLERAFDPKVPKPIMASRELLMRRGSKRVDPLKRIDEQIRHLTEEIDRYGSEIIDTVMEAVTMNAAAVAINPDQVSELAARWGARVTKRRVPASAKN